MLLNNIDSNKEFNELITENILKRFNFGFALNPYVSAVLVELNKFDEDRKFDNSFYESSYLIKFIIADQWPAFKKAFFSVYNESKVQSASLAGAYFRQYIDTMKKIDNKLAYDKYISRK